MPELPEVEVLRRHLQAQLPGRVVRDVQVHRTKAIRPLDPAAFARRLAEARFIAVDRRAKFLVFRLQSRRGGPPFLLLGHLGMTGRMFLQPASTPVPRHAVVVLNLGKVELVFDDARRFGRLTLDTSNLAGLGPEPLDPSWRAVDFWNQLRRSRQAVKVRLLDQGLVAGIGNIYASEALFQAGLSPGRRASALTRAQGTRLHASIRRVLTQAIDFGGTVELDWGGKKSADRLFYYGNAAPSGTHKERLWVYGRADLPCLVCATTIRRLVQAGRSTYYCPVCQRG
jgi:formamidopyrimidine-DNA glycosylase